MPPFSQIESLVPASIRKAKRKNAGRESFSPPAFSVISFG